MTSESIATSNRGATMASPADVAASTNRDQFTIHLTDGSDGTIRVVASGSAGMVNITAPYPAIDDVANDSRATGERLFAAAFPADVLRLLDECRLRPADGTLRIALDLDGPFLAALPWELMRDPETERYIALAETTPFERQVRRPLPLRLGGAVRVPSIRATRPAPELGQLRVVSLSPDRPALVAPWTRLAVLDGDSHHAIAALARSGTPAVIALPATMPTGARDTFFRTVAERLRRGDAIGVAIVAARRAVAETDLEPKGRPAWSLPVYAVNPVARRRWQAFHLKRVREEAADRSVGFARSTLSGAVTSVVVFLLGLVLFRLGVSDSPTLKIDLFSPYSMFQSFKGLVLELSTFQDSLLLILGQIGRAHV